jgi:hypothetical protein
MPKYETCFRCGGRNLEPGKIHGGKLMASASPNIVFFGDNAKMLSLAGGLPIEAYLCTDCGSIELVVDPEKAKRHLRPREE